MTDLIIEEGFLHVYYVFDIGAQIDLTKAKAILAEKRISDAIRLRKNPKSILIIEHPVSVQMDDWQQLINDETFSVKTIARVWSFGALSLSMTLKLGTPCTLEKLCEISHYLATDRGFRSSIMGQVKALTDLLLPSIEKPAIWEQCEEYFIFNITKAQGIDPADARKSFMNPMVASLILSEPPIDFSNQILEGMFRNIYQYSTNDAVLIHWNSALIYDPDDAEDIATTIEFALCLMLELRFYDDLLDAQLKVLYQSIENPKNNIFVNPYGELSRAAALQYIDISELVDRISNGFKITGDYYYASIYKAANREFQVEAWRKSVDNKLDNLAEVSKLFQGEVNERRNQLMEIVIIILIAFEVIPFIYSLITGP